jgi:hypothetical protein
VKYDAGRPDQRKRPGSLWLNFSRAHRGGKFGPFRPIIWPAFRAGSFMAG